MMRKFILFFLFFFFCGAVNISAQLNDSKTSKTLDQKVKENNDLLTVLPSGTYWYI